MLRKIVAVFAVSMLTLVTACGDDDDSGADATDTTQSVSDEGDGAATNTDDAEEFRIGTVFSQTGPGAATGLDGYRAIQLAVDDINDAGGCMVGDTTYVFEHETKDIQSDPNLAAQATQDLIEGFGADVIIGAENSAATTPIVNVVQRAGDVMMIAVATMFDEFVGQGDPMFRTVPPDDLLVNEGYIPKVAEMLPDVERVALMFQNDPVGTDLAASYAESFEENGIEVVATELFAAGETNFVPLLQRIPTDIDGLVIGWYDDSSMASIMDAAQEVGLPTTFISRGTSALPGLERQDEIDAYAFTVLGEDPLAPSTPEAQELLDRYTEEFGLDATQVTWFLYTYYDYPGLLCEAMQEAGTGEDISAIAEAIRGLEYTEGVIPISFDEEGINTSPGRAGLITPDEIIVEEYPIG